MSNDDAPSVDLSNIPDDINWLRASFLMSTDSFDQSIKRAREYNSADDKFENTSLGGNYAINIPPQFTHTADPNLYGLGGFTDEQRDTNLPKSGDIVGMGMYFSEAIDDTKEVVHMRFGVPEFNSLARFVVNSYDMDLAKLAKQGEASEGLIKWFGKMIGTVAGFIVGVRIFSIVGLARLFNFASKLVTGQGFYVNNSRYYYLKSTMRMYWSTVNQMCNTLAVNLGILPNYIWDGSYETFENNRFSHLYYDSDKSRMEDRARANLTPKIVEEMHRALPDIFRKDGGIDVRSVANRAKRLSIARQDKLLGMLEEFEQSGEISGLRKELGDFVNEGNVGLEIKDDGNKSYVDWFTEYLNARISRDTGEDNIEKLLAESIENAGESEEGETGSVAENLQEESILSIMSDKVSNWIYSGGEPTFKDGAPTSRPSDSMKTYMEAERYSGSDWVTFRVTGEKTVTESFSNEFGQPAVAERLNSTAGSVNEARFSFAGGNIGVPGLQSVIDFVTSTAGAAVRTVGNITGFGGLGILLGGGFVDIPNVWKGSTANLPKVEYKFELRATYGNKISIFTDIYVPLMMLLASALPLSTGRSSYTSPFLVEVYRKGKSQIRTGIVESLSITRGVGNSGWSVDQLPLAIDVTLSIADLTTIMHMPIMETMGNYDDSSAYSDYMATLGSLGLMDITAWQNITQRAKAKFRYEWGQTLFNSKSNLASFTMNAGIDVLGTNISIRSLVNALGDVEKIGR